MTRAVDRVSGALSLAAQGWTGRWYDDGHHVLDTASAAAGAHTRDDITSADLDALATLEKPLTDACASGMWTELASCQLLASHDDETLQLQQREQVLKQHIESIARVCSRFITRLGERAELLPVARVKRPARRAIDRLVGHTEDWAARTLAGPIPRRALAITRTEDADLYENRMVVELIHPILDGDLRSRINLLRRLKQDLADLERARHEGTRLRLDRLYRFWGAEAINASKPTGQATQTLRALEKLLTRVQTLRGSELATLLRGRRTGQRSLRRTNVTDNDRHYHAAGIVWREYERPETKRESTDARHERLGARHRLFDDYVMGLIARSLDNLACVPTAGQISLPDQPASLDGPWGPVTIHREHTGVTIVESAGVRTRFVPLLDLLSPDADESEIRERWRSLSSASVGPTVVVFLASSEHVRGLVPDLSLPALSSGPDGQHGRSTLVGVPVSPLETTSLERVARAVSIATLEPALAAYPPEIRLPHGKLPRRLIDYLWESKIAQEGLPPLLDRPGLDHICMRRPLTTIEQTRLDSVLSVLEQQATARRGWERDIATAITQLREALETAAEQVRGLLRCPGCGVAAGPEQVTRSSDIFSITCRSCNFRWGHERCGSCQSRIAILEPTRDVPNPEVSGIGWVERIFGRDALASPCWARTVPNRYVCPSCGACPISDHSEGKACSRCHGAKGT
ncbi:hypothetical protein FXF50_04900 [Micromonospora sp. AP08]|uniref:hypothetical protein n=1 Tax=Micromonospora sp. AP08 TaxID=2604467 RepID=UPI0011D64B02|nr:hypothetical protein [Micromonospora sp. AP08]TYB39719.1 hypothetical protein FXF50_04900 [Micromonospora sp. AP08]